MSQATHPMPANVFEFSLASRQSAPIAQQTRKLPGLSFSDISDASDRATAKNRLTVRLSQNHAFRTV